MNSQILKLLVCPREKLPLTCSGGQLSCAHGHIYAIVEGVPILLLREVQQTHVEGDRSLAFADPGSNLQPPRFVIRPGEVDPFVNNSIGATNGSLYQHLVGNLRDYPIPELRLRKDNGNLFLEIGCNWGRWCIAAARAGFVPVGIDPSLKSILAARRVAQQLGIVAHYLVADGRSLPFADASFDQIFSYSVLQHLSRENVRLVLSEVRRVLVSEGGYKVQMPNAYGIRCLYHQVRRRFREATDFEVRYWKPGELMDVFGAALGNARISVDGFFSLNAQVSDLSFLPKRYRALVRASDVLRRLSHVLRPLIYAADSVYVSGP